MKHGEFQVRFWEHFEIIGESNFARSSILPTKVWTPTLFYSMLPTSSHVMDFFWMCDTALLSVQVLCMEHPK